MMVLTIVLMIVMTVVTSPFTHLSKVVDCCLIKRSKQNKCVDDNNGDGVDNSVDGDDKHLTHLSKVVDCCLTERSKQNKHVDDNNGD
eukprot:12249618-Ditylum_brightwellii.AAC.1